MISLPARRKRLTVPLPVTKEGIILKSAVVIKSFPDGISVILNPEQDFEEIKRAVERKFSESAKFFGTAKVVLSFEGRKLSASEEMELIEIINSATQIEIACVMEKDPEKNEIYLNAMNKFAESSDNNDGQFYRGNLRSGQTLETDYSIVILGDVNPGAKVVSTGNIVVLGTLYGTAYAGINNNGNNFVAALDMKPTQIKIGDIIAKQGEKGFRGLLRSKPVMKIAYIENSQIVMKPITKELLNDPSLLY